MLRGGASPPEGELMKRTTVVLDKHLLEQAMRLSGAKTQSALVQRALTDYVRSLKAWRLAALARNKQGLVN